MPSFPYDVIIHNFVIVMVLTAIYYALGAKFIKWRELELKEEEEEG